jgi:hypothetical protein
MRSIIKWFADRQTLRRQEHAMRDFAKDVSDVYARSMMGEKSPELAARLDKLALQMAGPGAGERSAKLRKTEEPSIGYDNLTGSGKAKLLCRLLDDMGISRIFQAYVNESAFASVVIGECTTAAWHGQPAPTVARAENWRGRSPEETGAKLRETEEPPIGYDKLTGSGKAKLLRQLLDDMGISRIFQAYIGESAFASVVIDQCTTAAWHEKDAPTVARFENWRGHTG